jgi:hypothetical protein
VWQTPQASSRTSTSPARGSARSTSWTTSGCANSSRTSARIFTAQTLLNPWVEAKINRRFNPGADDGKRLPSDHGGMTTTEYLLNAAFVLLVLRQAKERELDRRSVIVPLLLMFFVGAQYLHSIPTTGNDLVLIALLAAVGLTLGVLGGLTTQVRVGADVALARVGWIAGGLLVLGIGARMAFAFAIGHGFEPTVRSFSIAHQIGAAAWPVALVLMAFAEVGSRIAIVQLRGRNLVAA